MSKLLQDCKDAIAYLNDIGGSMCHTADTLKSAIERLEALEKKLEAISEIACSEEIKDKCNWGVIQND